MATRADTDFSNTETLAAIMEDEIRSCRAILSATEAVEAALDPLDLAVIDDAVATRGREFRVLEDLEQRAQGFRGADFLPPADLAESLTLLTDLTHKIKLADKRARAATSRAMAAMQGEIKAVNEGQRGVRGYRGSTKPTPRFADKKG